MEINPITVEENTIFYQILKRVRHKRETGDTTPLRLTDKEKYVVGRFNSFSPNYQFEKECFQQGIQADGKSYTFSYHTEEYESTAEETIRWDDF